MDFDRLYAPLSSDDESSCSYTFSIGNQRQAVNPPHGDGDCEVETRTLACRNVSAADSGVMSHPSARFPASREVANFCTVVSREDKADAEPRAFRAPGEVDGDIDLRMAARRDTTLQLDRQRYECFWMTTSGSRRLCH